jgi:hypothetical protein
VVVNKKSLDKEPSKAARPATVARGSTLLAELEKGLFATLQEDYKKVKGDIEE